MLLGLDDAEVEQLVRDGGLRQVARADSVVKDPCRALAVHDLVPELVAEAVEVERLDGVGFPDGLLSVLGRGTACLARGLRREAVAVLLVFPLQHEMVLVRERRKRQRPDGVRAVGAREVLPLLRHEVHLRSSHTVHSLGHVVVESPHLVQPRQVALLIVEDEQLSRNFRDHAAIRARKARQQLRLEALAQGH